MDVALGLSNVIDMDYMFAVLILVVMDVALGLIDLN